MRKHFISFFYFFQFKVVVVVVVFSPVHNGSVGRDKYPEGVAEGAICRCLSLGAQELHYLNATLTIFNCFQGDCSDANRNRGTSVVFRFER